MAISTVALRASGRSSKSAPISARVLKAWRGVSLRAAVVRDEAAVRDGEQGVVGVVIARLGEEGLVGGHHREAVGVGEPQQFPLDHALVGQAVAQDLDVEVVLAEGGLQLRETAGGEFDPPLA